MFRKRGGGSDGQKIGGCTILNELAEKERMVIALENNLKCGDFWFKCTAYGSCQTALGAQRKWLAIFSYTNPL